MLAASTNKAQLYDYFGSKEGLFQSVFLEHSTSILDAVPFEALDLGGYAARLYDLHLAKPEFVRLAVWLRLESRPVGELITDDESHAAKVADIADIADAQRVNLLDNSYRPTDLLNMVIALAMTWPPITITILHRWSTRQCG